MELEAAQKEFSELVQRLDSSKTLSGFLKWVKDNWFSNNIDSDAIESAVVVNGQEAGELLERIASDLRQQLPIEAHLPSETIIFPTEGHNSDCVPSTTINVDGFLYDDKLVDVLCDEGKLPKNYCLACGCKNTKPLTFISHSASRENLAYVFGSLLPDLSGKHLLDVGSRFGAVLFGAYAYSQAKRISGVEINPDLSALSLSMINKYNMQSRVEVYTGDVRLFPQLVSAADVVVMNNVFEFFAPVHVQRELWLAMRQLIKPGALLLTCPSLVDSISHLNTEIQLDEWVEPLNDPSSIAMDSDDDSSSTPEMELIHLYRVL